MIEEMRVSKEMRRWFAGPMMMLWLGIYFTGFDKVNFLIYIPAVMSVFAFTTGLCPGMMMVRRRMAKKRIKEEI